MPTVTKNLIIINVLLFLAQFVAQSYGINLSDYLGLHFFLADNFNPAQLFTYMFMHGGFTHIFFNMFAVWMFGRILEQVWGPKRFLFYYILCGVGAGLLQEGVQYIQYVTELSQYTSVNIGTGIIPMSAGFRNAVPQPAVVHLPAAFPHQGKILRYRICPDRTVCRFCQ